MNRPAAFRRGVIANLGDGPTFWSVLLAALATSAVQRLAGSWGWVISLLGLLLCSSVYLLVAKPDDPRQPRLITRAVRVVVGAEEKARKG